MTEDGPGAALRGVAAHPYLLAADAASGAAPIRGSMPTTEVLDLGFGVADGLVELHFRGLVHGGVSSSSLVSLESGGLRLVLPSSAEGGDAATDVAQVRAALAALLPAEPDPLTTATRSVLTDPTITTAVGLRDALAAVRLGELPVRSATAAAPPTIRVTGAAGAGVRASPVGDRAPLEARQGPGEPDIAPASPPQLRSAALVGLMAITVLIVVAAAVYLVLR